MTHILEGMVKRTSINLDVSLVDQARAVLGTAEVTQTIHAALRDVVRRQKLRDLAARQFPDLTPEALTRMRAVRGARS